jgi:hypothetical protein
MASLPNPYGILGGTASLAYNYVTSTSTSTFANVPTTKVTVSPGFTIGVIAIVILVIILLYFSCKAVYNLTDSAWQTVCYFLFGVGYLYIAVLYYGLSGYKFKLSGNSSNNRN